MPKKIPYHRKRLGQIFLRDALVVERILQSASLAPNDLVLEVGPGRGILTAALAQHTHALYAIEVDAHYARTLQQHFASATHVHVRAQELSVRQFVQLAQVLQSLRGADRDEAAHSRNWLDPAPELPL